MKLRARNIRSKDSVRNIEENPATIAEPLFIDEVEPLPEYSKWRTDIRFLLCSLASALSLANVWRFPYQCVKYGGGTFIIPYLIFLIFCGVPLFLMEMTLGQSTGLNGIQLFIMVPILQGLGWLMLTMTAVVAIYYNVIVAYILYYFGMSFRWALPWETCSNAWNTDNCVPATAIAAVANGTTREKITALVSAGEEFLTYNVLDVAGEFETHAVIHWKLLMALVGASILTFIWTLQGIPTSRRVAVITATIPSILLIVVLIRSCTLTGAWNGLSHLILPDWRRLLELEVWSSAGIQAFYSLGTTWGGLIVFSSYNRFGHSIRRDTISTPIFTVLASLLSCVTVYASLGHIMHITGRNEIDELIAYGPAIPFLAYSHALTQLPGCYVWSVFFFLAICLVGLTTQYTNLQTIIVSLSEQFPLSIGKHLMKFTFLICVLQLLFGLSLITKTGFYYLQLMDSYCALFAPTIIALLEAIVVGFLYGANQFLDDLEDMGRPMYRFTRTIWISLWCMLVPSITLVLLAITIATQVLTINEKLEKFPLWALILGWTTAVLPIIELPIFSFAAIYEHGCDTKTLFLPDDEWDTVVEIREASSPNPF